MTMTVNLSDEARETRNTLFSALSNHRRRYVLYACTQADGETKLSDIAEQVAVWEYDKPIDEITSKERKRVYTSIQQHHLSKLEEADLIVVNGDRISATEKAKGLDVYLEVVPEETIPWPVYYLGVSAIGSVVLGFSYLGWFPDPISLGVIAAMVVLSLFISSVIHLLQSDRIDFTSSEIAINGVDGIHD